jgi:hypothetical protein
MKSLSKGALALAVVCVCMCFALLAPAAPQDANPKKTAQKAKANPDTRNFKESELKVHKKLPDRPPIPFTKWTPKDVQTYFKDPNLTLKSPLSWTRQGKKITMTVQKYIDQVNPGLAWLANHGFGVNDLPQYPKGGLVLGVASKGTPGSFAKQKTALVAKHAKASPAEKKAQALFDKASQSKDKAAAKTAAKKHQDAFDLLRREEIANLLKKIDRTKLSVADQKQLAEIEKEFKATKKITAQNLPGVKQITGQAIGYHKNQTWSLGSADIAEVDLVADLDINATINFIKNTIQYTARGSLQANCFILDGARSSPHNFVDVVAEITTGSPQSQFQAHAKVVGTDLFTPVNQKFNTDGTPLTNSVDPSYNQTLTQGVIEVFGFDINYSVNLKGDVKFNLTAEAFPTEVIASPVIAVNSSLSATATVDVLVLEVGVKGTLNLINDTLTLSAKAGIVSDGKTGFIDIFGSAQNSFSTLGGEIDLVGTLDLGFTHVDLGSIVLFSVPDQVTTSGFLFGPDESKTPIF